jgi:predicted dinucleotide-binding enzyme
MTTFGIIGAGQIGSNVAKAVIARGHDVVIANSRGPETLTSMVAELGPNARAATVEEAATAGEVVLVAVPLRAYRDLPVAPLAGKIVLDANNYYFERDGHIDALDRGEATTSGLLQEHLAESKVAKAFNHIMAHQIPTDGMPRAPPTVAPSPPRVTTRRQSSSSRRSTTTSGSTRSRSARSPSRGASSATAPPTSFGRTASSW